MAAPFRAGGAGVPPVHAEEGRGLASAASSAAACSIPEATLPYTIPDSILIKFADIIGYTGPDKISKSREIINAFFDDDRNNIYFIELRKKLPAITTTISADKQPHLINVIKENGSVLNRIYKQSIGGDPSVRFIKILEVMCINL